MKKEMLYTGKYINLVSRNNWEYVERSNTQKDKADAVTIIAQDISTRKYMCIVENRTPLFKDLNEKETEELMKKANTVYQKDGFRFLIEPKIKNPNGYIVSFVAGLIDEGETAISSAIREFKEECGFTLKPIKESKIGFNSAGLTNESTVIVYGTFNSEENCEQELQDSEDITPVLISDLDALYGLLNNKGFDVTSKVCQHFEMLDLINISK